MYLKNIPTTGSGGGALPLVLGFCAGAVGRNLKAYPPGLPTLGDHIPRNLASSFNAIKLNRWWWGGVDQHPSHANRLENRSKNREFGEKFS